MVFMARVADQAQRYNDMLEYLTQLIDTKDWDLNSDERNLLSVVQKLHKLSQDCLENDYSAKKHIPFLSLAFPKQGKECKVEAGFETGANVYDGAGAYVGAGDGTPSGSNPRGTIIFYYF